MVLRLSSKITYRLWVSDGRYRVSEWFCDYPARSRTVYGWAMGDTKSVHGSATIQQDHVQIAGDRQERQSQRVILKLSKKITYSLRVSDGRYKVSEWFCDYPARSRTGYGWPKGDSKSVNGSATIQKDHVQAMGGQRGVHSK